LLQKITNIQTSIIMKKILHLALSLLFLTTFTRGVSAQTLSASVTGTNATCYNSCNGSLTVAPTGGTAPYTYSWSPSSGTTSTINNLCAGNYTVTVTDHAGASISKGGLVQQPTAITISPGSQTNVSCNGGSNGTASVTVTGGTGTYTFNWAPTPGGGQGTSSVTGLVANNYTLFLSDANGCSNYYDFNITEPAPLTANTASTNTACFGGNDGTASISVSGGTANYTYSWNPPPTAGQGTANVSGLNAGTYTVTCTDANGCAISQAGTILQPPPITIAISATPDLCFGDNNGSATSNPSGGTPGYTYSWAPLGGSGSTINGLPAGTYTVTCTDTHGCTSATSVAVTQPTILGIVTTTSTSESCISCCDATATVNPAGGTTPYSFSWNSSPIQNGQTAAALCKGTYTACVTDAHGCSICDTVAVSFTNGIPVQQLISFQVSPNPAGSLLHITLPSGYSQMLQLTVLNVLGEAVYIESFLPTGGSGKTITVDQLPRGMYFLQLRSGHQQHTVRFLKN
jgi:hypothetical protein